MDHAAPRRAAGLTEYAVVVVLVALAVLASVRVFGATAAVKYVGTDVTVSDLETEVR